MFVAARDTSFLASRTGLGDGSQIIGTTGIIAGSILPKLLPLFGVAGPIGLAVGAGVTALATALAAFGVGKGCGQSCIAASQNADEIERALKANLAAFEAGQIDQPTALSSVDQLWAALESACGQIGGDAGRNCIADRQEGACKWKDSQGECWNWFTGYRDPIAAAAPAPSLSLASRVSTMSAADWLLAGLLSWAVVEVVN